METLQGGGNSDPSHPDYIKIILDKRLNDTTINNFNQMVGMNLLVVIFTLR